MSVGECPWCHTAFEGPLYTAHWQRCGMPEGKLRPIGNHAYRPIVTVEQVLANEKYMAAVRQALEDERQGKGVAEKDLKRRSEEQ